MGIEAATSTEIETVETHAGGQIIAPAGSDQGTVAAWLGCFTSRPTQDGYRGDIAGFIGFVAMPLRHVTLSDIQAYRDSLAHLAPITIARRLSAVKSLFKFAVEQTYLPSNPAVSIKLPKIKDTLTERIMSEEQTFKLLGAVRNPRDAVLLRLIYGAGLRLAEVSALRWRDFKPRDGGEGQVNVFGKGGVTRVVLLPASLWTRVIALRGCADDADAVFRSRKGGTVHARQIHRIVKSAAVRAGLSSKISAHWLRHAHASHALDRNCPVHILQSTLGHASLTTTTRYTHARPGDSSARYLSS